MVENTAAVTMDIRLDELRELVNEIPDGTIYSVDISEVIEIGQNED